MIKKQLQGFLDFIREQGVINVAIAFVLGGAVSKLVTALVTDILNPILGIFLGATASLKDMYLPIGDVKILFGDFLSSLIDFLVITLVIYFALKLIKIDRIDKKKEEKKEEKKEKEAKTDTKTEEKDEVEQE